MWRFFKSNLLRELLQKAKTLNRFKKEGIVNFKKFKFSSLVEKLILLFTTAILTGLLIPYILQNADGRRQKEEIILNAELQKQNKLSEAKVEFLDNLHDLLWQFQITAIDVTFYDNFDNNETSINARKRYQETAGPILASIRSEISKSYRLNSIGQYNVLREFFYNELLPLDLRIEEYINKDLQRGLYGTRLNTFLVYDFASQIDDLLNNLAIELDLVENDSLRDSRNLRKLTPSYR